MFHKKGSASSATLWGVEAEPVHVAVEVVAGPTQFEILASPIRRPPASPVSGSAPRFAPVASTSPRFRFSST
jgi:hypothetical protein